MPLPRPLVVSTVTTEGSTFRTSAGRSAPAAVTGAMEVVGVAVVPVEPELVELLHAARKMNMTASSRSIQSWGLTVDDGLFISSAPDLHSPTSARPTAAQLSARQPPCEIDAHPAQFRFGLPFGPLPPVTVTDATDCMKTFALRRHGRHGPVSPKPGARTWPHRPKRNQDACPVDV